MSFVEIMMTLAIGLLMISGTVYLFRQSRGSVESAAEKSSALKYGRMLAEYLKRDLRAAYWMKEKSDTSIDLQGGGIAFTRIRRGYATPDQLERVVYTFDAGSGIVTRESQSDGKIRFGDAQMKIREFTIERGERRVAYLHNCWFRLRLRLSDPEDSPRSRFFLADKIRPPVLQTRNGIEWVD